jgi:hypothetical protein
LVESVEIDPSATLAKISYAVAAVLALPPRSILLMRFPEPEDGDVNRKWRHYTHGDLLNAIDALLAGKIQPRHA